MAVQSIFYTIDGETKTYPSTKHIATKAHMAIRLQLISDDTYVLIDVTAYELITNAAVLVEAPNPKIYKQLEVRVADNPDELDTGLSDIAIVASIADEVVIVANNVEDVTNFSDVYLGARSSAPTTRTDGSALEVGDLYFNTTDDSIYVYTGSVWASSVITDHTQLTSIGTNTHAEIDTYIAAIRSIAQGGTGSATAAGARTNLGLVIGTDVQAYDVDIATVAASQGEMEAGTETALRSMSPERVKQAIEASATSGLPQAHISGLIWENDSTDVVNDFSVSTGKCRSSADDIDFTFAASQIKQMDVSWATGTNAGALSSSLAFTASVTYHIFAMTVGGTAEIGVDTSTTGANLVADHSATIIRRIGSFYSGATPNLPEVLNTETAGGGIHSVFFDRITEFSGAGSGSPALLALSIPGGVRFLVHLIHKYFTDGTIYPSLYTVGTNAPGNTSQSADFRVTTLGQNVAIFTDIYTDTSGQIYRVAYATASSQVITTIGYTDERGL